ncbi:MAG: hypothetical protein GX979_12285 [Firmicutes bacterium]|nr:hypothetical protein [Bacillota bacterium]
MNSFCQSHDLPNLYICDASVSVISGGAKSSQTVMATGSCAAEHLIRKRRRFLKGRMRTSGFLVLKGNACASVSRHSVGGVFL